MALCFLLAAFIYETEIRTRSICSASYYEKKENTFQEIAELHSKYVLDKPNTLLVSCFTTVVKG